MTDELLKALQLIKEECEKHTMTVSLMNQRGYCKCKSCPLSTADGDCGITQLEPSEWELKKREVYF